MSHPPPSPTAIFETQKTSQLIIPPSRAPISPTQHQQAINLPLNQNQPLHATPTKSKPITLPELATPREETATPIRTRKGPLLQLKSCATFILRAFHSSAPTSNPSEMVETYVLGPEFVLVMEPLRTSPTCPIFNLEAKIQKIEGPRITLDFKLNASMDARLKKITLSIRTFPLPGKQDSQKIGLFDRYSDTSKETRVHHERTQEVTMNLAASAPGGVASVQGGFTKHYGTSYETVERSKIHGLRNGHWEVVWTWSAPFLPPNAILEDHCQVWMEISDCNDNIRVGLWVKGEVDTIFPPILRRNGLKIPKGQTLEGSEHLVSDFILTQHPQA